jgi:hypothetical protein
MQVGDLVKFKNNGMTGLIVKVVKRRMDDILTILWADGIVGTRYADELEIINASR